jgi:hypothetical protein
MEPTPGQRKAAFALIVVALAGLGIFLVRPGASGSAGPARSPAPSRSASPPGSSPAVALTPPPAATPAPGTTPGSALTTAGTANIYQWLPFTAAELTRAAAVATRFGALYETFSYSESAAAYVQKMRSTITAQLAQVLGRAYATPGLAGPRAKTKQVSVGFASITSLRAFGSASVTFIVAISQKITDTGGTSRSAGQYAVTVVGSGSSWQVSDIQLASAGNS